MDPKELILSLYDHGIFKLGQFVLKSGDTSPFYVDLRLIPSFPHIFKATVNEYVKLMDLLPYDIGAVAGIMSAGIPFATGIALELDIPLLQIRKTSKTHGLKNLVEGKYNGSEKVVLIDDLISTGVSKIPAFNALASENYSPGHILVFIDRMKPENDFHLEFKSSFKIIEILEILSKSGRINEKEINALEDAIEKWTLD